MKRQRTDLIIIHCSATPPDMDIGADTIRDWHVNDNHWKDIGYHFVIRRNGRIELGRDIGVVGAHCSGQNRTSVGICMVGGVDAAREPSDDYTQKQWATLDFLISVLERIYPNARVAGHNEFASKACPSFDVQEWLSVREAHQ